MVLRTNNLILTVIADFSRPIKSPIIIFLLILLIILVIPMAFRKIKVPYIIGFIMAGMLFGPYGLNFLQRDSSIILFGTVGLLKIMFLSGLEIELSELKKNITGVIFFGLLTFLLPLTSGILINYYFLNYNILSATLLASMFSTHTLISYPIISKYKIMDSSAVTLAIGGTIITDTLALMILAVVSGMANSAVNASFWFRLGGSSIIFICLIFFGFPLIIRWFFKKNKDIVSQYIFILVMIFLAALLAELAGIEAIIGAFFSGLVLNKFVPHTSPLMKQIKFVGNTLFIPFFLINVGMLIDVSILLKSAGALKVTVVIIIVAISMKYIAAKITQKVFDLTKNEGDLIFGLSSSHAAATLAIVLVGYNIIIGKSPNGDLIRLLNEDVLNSTIILILMSCAISSIQVEKSASMLVQLKQKRDIVVPSVEIKQNATIRFVSDDL